MTTLLHLTIELDDELAQKLSATAKDRGWTPESIVVDCVAQHLEIAVRHRALVERFEAVDEYLATLAHFVGSATQGGTPSTSGSSADTAGRRRRSPSDGVAA